MKVEGISAVHNNKTMEYAALIAYSRTLDYVLHENLRKNAEIGFRA